MHILQLISTFYPALAFGGPTKSAFELSKALANRGHKIEVFTTNAYNQNTNFKSIPSVQTTYGFQVNYFNNTFRYGNLFVSHSMIKALRKKTGEFDLVHTHYGRQIHDFTLGYYASLYNVPLILQARGDIPRIMTRQRSKLLYDTFFGSKLLKKASKVIALSQTEVEQYESVGVKKEKIVVIPNGINLNEYNNLPQRGIFRNRFSIPEDQKIILFLGRLHPIKGIDILLKAFSRIMKEANDIILIIAGPDDGYLSTCQEMVRQLKIEKKVVFTGALFGTKKIEAYVDADVFACPSRYEIFGNVVLESYACSKPVVASRVGGLKEIVFHGKTGLLVKPEDEVDLSSALRLILKDDKTRSSMGSQAKKVVIDKFSLNKTVDKLETTYEEIVKR
jgi:glycosyltransferase involved in cell wall biosynthesis